MKKLLSLLLVIAMMTSVFCATTFAADEIKITINDEAKTFDVMPVIVDGRTFYAVGTAGAKVIMDI